MSSARERGTLYGVIFAPYVRKARAVLALKGIAHGHVSVMPGAMDPAFLAKSPLSQVPVWEEPGFVVPDSSAICAYLERIVALPALYPSDPRAFASALFWEEYGDTRLVDTIEPVFFQRIVRTRVLRQACDEEVVKRQLGDVVPAVLDQLEALYFSPGPLRAGIETIVGTSSDGAPAASRGRALGGRAVPDVGDLAIWSPLLNLEHVGEAIDPDRWPALAAFMAAMNAHPSLAPIVATERAALGAR